MSNYVPARRNMTRKRGHRSSKHGRVYAAIDLGTNNCRLLIARPSGNSFQVIDAFSRIVRLGEGLAHTQRLSECAMNRTLAALHVCAQKLRRRGVTHLRAVATEACRRAENCQSFLSRVALETGIELEVIDSNEEAQLAWMGCAPLLDPTVANALIFDIGGGSTEISWLDAAPLGADMEGPGSPLRAWKSLPHGVVTLAEQFDCETIDLAGYEEMVALVASSLTGFDGSPELDQLTRQGSLQMLGTSGTVTTLASVHKALPRYQRSLIDGCYLDFATIDDVTRRIIDMTQEDRYAHPCIGRERADLVIAGCAILEALCRAWPVGRLRVADRGLREGILFQLMKRNGEPVWRRRGEPRAAQ